MNTFDQDKLTVEKAFDLKEHLQISKKPIVVHFSGNNRRELDDNINTKLKDVIKVTLDEDEKFAHGVLPQTV